MPNINSWNMWTFILIIVVYTLGFSITLWKEKNKVGSIAVFSLTMSVIILPFFSVIQ